MKGILVKPGNDEAGNESAGPSCKEGEALFIGSGLGRNMPMGFDKSLSRRGLDMVIGSQGADAGRGAG